jgi:hypothetical protein
LRSPATIQIAWSFRSARPQEDLQRRVTFQ